MAKRSKKKTTRKKVRKRTKTIFRRLSEDAGDTMADMAFTNPLGALGQLYDNAHDSDSSHVSVQYEPDEDFFRISDDGRGMDSSKPELDGFFRYGGSKKRDDRTTPKGRKIIGKYNIGVKTIERIAEEMELETIFQGVKTKTHQNFIRRRRRLEEPIDLEISEAGEEERGTTITLRGLKFGPDTGVTKSRLKKYLRTKIRPKPDFKVRLNGEEIENVQLETAEEFDLSLNGERFDKVTGRVYLTKRSTPDAGIYFYVQDGLIGSPEDFKFNGSSGFKSRLVAIVEADCLDRHTTYNKDGFKRTKAIAEFEERLKEYLQDIQRRHEKSLREDAKSRALVSIEDSVAAASVEISKALRKEINSGVEIRITDENEVKRRSKGKARMHFNKSTNEVFLDESLPALTVRIDYGRRDLNGYGERARELSVEAIALERFREKATRAQLEAVHRFLEERSELIERVTGNKRGSTYGSLKRELGEKDRGNTLDPKKAYTSLEVSNVAELDEDMVKRMVECGCIGTNPQRINGEEMLSVLELLGTQTPLFSALRPVVLQDAFIRTLGFIERKIGAELEKGDISYLTDIGRSRAFYLVRNPFVPAMRGLIKDSRYAEEDIFRRIDNTYGTGEETIRLLGITKAELTRIVRYAKREGINLDKSSRKYRPSQILDLQLQMNS